MDYAVEKTCCERCLHIVRSVLCVCWNLKTSGVVVLAVSVIVGEDALKLHRKKNTSNRGCRQGLRQKKGVGKLDEGFKDWQPLCFQFKRPASVVYYVCFFFFSCFCLVSLLLFGAGREVSAVRKALDCQREWTQRRLGSIRELLAQASVRAHIMQELCGEPRTHALPWPLIDSSWTGLKDNTPWRTMAYS